MSTTAVLTGADSIVVPSSGRYVDRDTVTVFTDAEWTSLASVSYLFTLGSSAGESVAQGTSPWVVQDTALETSAGAVGDTAWSGSGNSTIVAALKAIYSKVAGTLGFSTNTGVMDAGTLRVTVATDGPLATNLGSTTDAAVVTDTSGTVSGKLRGLVTLAAARWPVLGQAVKAASVPVTLASDQGVLTVSGTTTANQGTAAAAGGAWPSTLTDLTTTASMLAGDTGQNAQLVAGNRKEVSFTTTTVQAVASTDVSDYRHVSVHIVTQGGSSTVTFQGSNDNANWVPTCLSNVGSTGTSGLASGTASASSVFAGPLSFRFFRLNVTGIVSGTTAGVIEFFSFSPVSQAGSTLSQQGGVWTVQPGNTANTTPWLTNIEGQKATYSASITGLAAVAGDVFTLTGSATKTVRVTRAVISGAATAAADVDLAWIKRSAANTGGTSSAPTAIPHDSNDAAATATVLAYTVAPTPGASVGTLFVRKVVVPSLTSPAVGTATDERTFELRGERAIVLRGTAQVFALNIASVPTGGAFDIDITWTEE